MKKFLALILIICCLFAVCSVFTACTDNTNEEIKIVTTIFPEYDWTMNVLGDHAEEVSITNLLNSGVDLHSYQPSVADIAAIATCDLFIYVGGESDEWVEDALKNATNKDMVVIDLLDVLADSALDEEIKDGMQHDHDHEHAEGEEHEHVEGEEHEHAEGEEHEHAEGEEHEHEHEHESDEHVWLSLKRAKVIVNKIAEALAKIDAENGDDYKANAQSYVTKLDALDLNYKDAVSKATQKTLVVADRFPFLYLVKDYGLDYCAAFSGCSAETEASFETIKFLADKVNELNLAYILKTEGSTGDIAQTVKNSTTAKNQKILTLNSLQSATTSGGTYLSIMESNLEVLREALS